MLEMLHNSRGSENSILPTFTGPGPQEPMFVIEDQVGLMAFYGEVPVSELITGDGLSSLLNFTQGVGINSGNPWLKFVLDGAVLFVAKTPYRHNVSWDNIHAVDGVYGTRIEVINGLSYRVRLLKGGDTNPSVATFNRNALGTRNSEWVRLMHPLTNNDPYIAPERLNPDAPYTNLDLATDTSPGRFSWCQESVINYDTYRVACGGNGTSAYGYWAQTHYNTNSGYRPCLELVN